MTFFVCLCFIFFFLVMWKVDAFFSFLCPLPRSGLGRGRTGMWIVSQKNLSIDLDMRIAQKKIKWREGVSLP